jgi:Zn-dependent peptidase ImmA (M78 family)
MDGAYAYDADLERGFMLINAKQFWTRRRFTMAHELGHHVLKHKSGVDRNVFEGTSPEEIAANAFAAELLMPEAEVRASPRIHGHDEIAELAANFLVSGKAMIIRLESLGLISKEARRRLDDTYDPAFYRRHLTTSSLDRDSLAETQLPANFIDRIFELYRVGDITADAACEALDKDIASAEDFLPKQDQVADELRSAYAGVREQDLDHRRL